MAITPKRLKSEADDLLCYKSSLVNQLIEARRLHGELARRNISIDTDIDYLEAGERLCHSSYTRVKDVPQTITSDIKKMKACLAKLELRRRLPYLVVLLVTYFVTLILLPLFRDIDAFTFLVTTLPVITIMILTAWPLIIEIMENR